MRPNAPTEPLLSIEDYADLPDEHEWRDELVRGLVVREPRPSWEHGRVQARIAYLLTAHLDAHALDLACATDFGAILQGVPATVRGPDVAVLRRERTNELHPAGFVWGSPELVVEVVSASNRAGEIQAKVEDYFSAGARTVWVVYPATRTIAVHDGPDGARFVHEHEELAGGSVLPLFRVGVAEPFR